MLNNWGKLNRLLAGNNGEAMITCFELFITKNLETKVYPTLKNGYIRTEYFNIVKGRDNIVS
jgi:hypothetical protein